jgi:hypothetical protein
MENEIIEFSNEDELNITPKLIGNNNYRFITKSPLGMQNLSKMIKKKPKQNALHKTLKIPKENENLLIDFHRNSINNINNLRSNLPNIATSLTPIEKRNNFRRESFYLKNKSPNTNNKSTFYSRNVESPIYSYNTDNFNFFENEQLNNTFQLKNLNKIKNKYNENDNDNINLSQILYMKNKNNISLGSNNLYARNIENKNNNYLIQNKSKFSLNKKNLMNTIKKPSKINLEKKNLKYKIPLDMINNYNYGKKKILNDIIEEEPRNNRKVNVKKRSNKSISGISPLRRNNKEFINCCSNMELYNNEKSELNINDSKAFIESTLQAFNGLVSQAQELSQILRDNKDMVGNKNKNESNNNNKNYSYYNNSNKLKNSINNVNDLNINSKLNKLNQEIKDEHKTVEELQKINSDLNAKINKFKENTEQYENKVKELVSVINQIKNTNSNNTVSNSNSNSDNYSNGFINNSHNIIMKDSNNNLILENRPKKKKTRYGFVETIFMRDENFSKIIKKKPPQYYFSNQQYLTIKKTNKEPKLVVVNMNRTNNDDNFKEKATKEEYIDAATQLANHIIIESLISLQKEEKEEE